MTEIRQPLPFDAEIIAHQQAETVSEAQVELRVGNSRLALRKRGSFITDCTLRDPETGAARAILYCEENRLKPKLTASHPMSPVGAYKDIGGQHGFPRWAEYHEFRLPDGPHGERRTSLQAMRSDRGLSIARAFELTPSALTIISSIRNSSQESASTSLGEHLYFVLPNEETAGLQVNGGSIDDLLTTPGAIDQIMQGESYFWPGFAGESLVTFPDGRRVELSAAAILEGREDESLHDQLGLLFWHRPGTESICFEPTWGFSYPDRVVSNSELTVPGWSGASLATTIKLV